MTSLQAILLAIIEGITEFLPISSTGHLILASEILKIEQTEFVKSFEIFIQLGAILAVIVLYWKTLLTKKAVLERIFVAFLPTAVLGFTFYKLIKQLLIGNALVTLAALFGGGIILIFLELLYKEKEHHVESIQQITIRKAFIIGLFQSLSMIPGVSRAAATIVGGLLLGTKRKAAVEFSFLLAIPTMLAATGFDLIKSNLEFTSNELTLLAIGFIGSFVVALLAVKFFLQFIQNNTFITFGIYRIVVSILFFLFVLNK